MAHAYTVPAIIASDKTLNEGDKRLFGIIYALSEWQGFCFATNGYFASEMGCSKQTVINRLNKLGKAGYVKKENVDIGGNTSRRLIPISNVDFDPPIKDSLPHQDSLTHIVYTPVTGVNTGEQVNNGKHVTGKHSYTDEIELIWDFWLEQRQKWTKTDNGRKPKLSDNRKGKIRARLREGYIVQDIREAILGAFNSSWHREKGLTTIEYILRNEGNVEMFRSRQKDSDAGQFQARKVEQEKKPELARDPYAHFETYR